MWIIEAWEKTTRSWHEIGRDEAAAKVEIVVRMAAARGHVCRATHPSGEHMIAYPHGRGFAYYRPLERQDEVQTDP